MLDVENIPTTVVYVSWNGATEVLSWRLYKSNSNGKRTEIVASARRLGFETILSYPSYASNVIAEALDANGSTLGTSSGFSTAAMGISSPQQRQRRAAK